MKIRQAIKRVLFASTTVAAFALLGTVELDRPTTGSSASTQNHLSHLPPPPTQGPLSQ